MITNVIDADIFVFESNSIKEALKKLSRIGTRVLLVVNDKKNLLGTLSDGDIRRYILKGEGLDNTIEDAYNKSPISIRRKEYTLEKARTLLLENKIELIPVVDDQNRVRNFVTWGDAFSKDAPMVLQYGRIDTPIVIMAGGKGKRLDPFSNIFPKALIPIGDKPIIELIIDEFRKYGASDYYISVNYKGGMIESYFNSVKKDYNITYVRETDFLGTIGSISLIRGRFNCPFIVSNCDIIVKADFADVLSFHKAKSASLTILSSIQHYKIPYGVITFKDYGEVVDLVEKPEYTFAVNAGVYVMSPECVDFIPQDEHFDITDLIRILIKNEKTVITYPVNENDYIDIGQLEEYKKAVSKLQMME